MNSPIRELLENTSSAVEASWGPDKLSNIPPSSSSPESSSVSILGLGGVMYTSGVPNSSLISGSLSNMFKSSSKVKSFLKMLTKNTYSYLF